MEVWGAADPRTSPGAPRASAAHLPHAAPNPGRGGAGPRIVPATTARAAVGGGGAERGARAGSGGGAGGTRNRGGGGAEIGAAMGVVPGPLAPGPRPARALPRRRRRRGGAPSVQRCEAPSGRAPPAFRERPRSAAADSPHAPPSDGLRGPGAARRKRARPPRRQGGQGTRGSGERGRAVAAAGSWAARSGGRWGGGAAACTCRPVPPPCARFQRRGLSGRPAPPAGAPARSASPLAPPLPPPCPACAGPHASPSGGPDRLTPGAPAPPMAAATGRCSGGVRLLRRSGLEPVLAGRGKGGTWEDLQVRGVRE
jgi:hypothetical protein